MAFNSQSTPFTEIPELQGPIGKYGHYYVYIRPESRGITPIWYKFNALTNDWQWTPYEWMDGCINNSGFKWILER